MLNFLLIYRITIINLIGAVCVAYAYSRGWVTIVLDGDSTGIVYLTVGLFLVGMTSLYIRAIKTSAGLNTLKKGKPLSIGGTKFLEKMAHLDDIPNWLTLLGLLGTVIGIMISLSGVDLNGLATPEGTKKAIAVLMDGMRVAFCTTIVGSVLAFWFDINRRILKTASVLLVEDAKPATSR